MDQTLTPHERAVLVDRICLGAKQAARKHGIHPQTVRNIMTAVYAKLGITGKENKLTLAMLAALRRGEIGLSQLKIKRTRFFGNYN